MLKYGEWLFNYVYANINGEVKSLTTILKEQYGNYSITYILSLYNDAFSWLYDTLGGHPKFVYTVDETTGEIVYTTELVAIDGRDHCVEDEDREYTVYPSSINLNTLQETGDDMLFTNPFLIRVNTAREIGI